MAATAWSFYNSFREYIGNGQFDLDGTSTGFYMALHTSAASALVNTKTYQHKHHLQMKLLVVTGIRLAAHL